MLQWISNLSAPLKLGPRFKLSSRRFYEQNLNCLSITRNIKVEGALYSVFYDEASKMPDIWEQELVVVDSLLYLIIMSASSSCSYKLIKLQSH